jgi:hypothetical protein
MGPPEIKLSISAKLSNIRKARVADERRELNMAINR